MTENTLTELFRRDPLRLSLDDTALAERIAEMVRRRPLLFLARPGARQYLTTIPEEAPPPGLVLCQ